MKNPNNAVEVELEPGLRDYRLPAPGTPEEIAEAIRRSWDLLLVAPTRVTAPLLAAAYAAPLSEIIVPDFVLWVYGGTGSYKSTIAALFLSHYGDFSETNLPLSFESTSNALERMLFLAKDVPIVVDDWRPGVTRGDSEEMDRKAQRLLRGVGNRQGRGRMTSTTTLRESYPPRGVVAVTAEALPEGPAFQSAAARSVSVNLSREDVDLARLSGLQQNKGMLPMSMAGYVRYVGARYDELSRELPVQRKPLRENFRGELPGSHPRAPDIAAVLVTGLGQLKEYTLEAGAMYEEEAREAYERAKDGVLEAAKAHVEATSGGDPSEVFIDIIRSLLETHRAHLRNREDGGEPPERERLGWSRSALEGGVPIDRPQGDMIGWADDECLYLHPKLAYAAVSAFVQRGSIPFGIKPTALWNALARSGTSMTDEGRNNTTARIEGETKRVIQIPRSALFGREPGLEDLW